MSEMDLSRGKEEQCERKDVIQTGQVSKMERKRSRTCPKKLQSFSK